jgi:hypothetical protein
MQWGHGCLPLAPDVPRKSPRNEMSPPYMIDSSRNRIEFNGEADEDVAGPAGRCAAWYLHV